jgi:hypothetical protein
MNMDDLMKALNQAGGQQAPTGGQQSSGQQGGGQMDLGGLLGALGGGGAGGGQIGLGSLLGALGSGGAGGGQLDLGNLLGALGGGAGGGSPFDALAGPLAEKLGISPQIASMVIMFLANALLGGKAGSRSGGVDTDSAANLNDVVKMLNSGQIDSEALQGNQLVQDLSQQTGLDQQTAARSIGAVVDMLGGQQGLEGLLGK